MASSSLYKDSSLIVISSLNELFRFSSSQNGQRFAAKSLILNKTMQFRLDLFPNGKTKEESGFVQLMLVSNKLPPNIKSIGILCRLYCKEVRTLYKQVQIINNKSNGEIIAWPIYHLPRSDCKYNEYSNNNHQLRFGADIELLYVKYHKKAVKNQLKLRKRNSRSRSKGGLNINNKNIDNINEIVDMFQYVQIRTDTQIQYEWNIDKQTVDSFKKARNGKAYYSMDINNIWCLCCYPNGQYEHNEGNLLLSLHLIRLPPKVKSIAVNIRLQIQNHQPFIGNHVKFDYNHYEQQWSTGSIPTFELLHKNNINSLRFVIVIAITKVYEYTNNDTKEREISIKKWTEYGIDMQYNGINTSNLIDDGDDSNDNFSSIKINSNRKLHSQSLGNYDEIENKYESNSPSTTTVKDLLPRSASEMPLPRRLNKDSPLGNNHEVTTNFDAFSERNDTRQRPSVDSYIHSSMTRPSTIGINDSRQSHPSFTNSKSPTSAYVHQPRPSMLGPLYDRQRTNTNTTIIHEEPEEEPPANPQEIKFKKWLNSMGCIEYYELFKKASTPKMQHIPLFNEQRLITIGITNELDRSQMIESAAKYSRKCRKFERVLKENKILGKFESEFKSHGILTLQDLKQDITDTDTLKSILKTNCDETIENVWSQIHPQSFLRPKMENLKQRSSKVLTEMAELIKQFEDINSEINTTNMMHMVDKGTLFKQEYETLIKRSHDQLTHHDYQIRCILDKIWNERLGSAGTITTMNSAGTKNSGPTYIVPDTSHSLTDNLSSITSIYPYSQQSRSGPSALGIYFRDSEPLITGYIRTYSVGCNMDNYLFEIVKICRSYLQGTY